MPPPRVHLRVSILLKIKVFDCSFLLSGDGSVVGGGRSRYGRRRHPRDLTVVRRLKEEREKGGSDLNFPPLLHQSRKTTCGCLSCSSLFPAAVWALSAMSEASDLSSFLRPLPPHFTLASFLFLFSIGDHELARTRKHVLLMSA